MQKYWKWLLIIQLGANQHILIFQSTLSWSSKVHAYITQNYFSSYES